MIADQVGMLLGWGIGAGLLVSGMVTLFGLGIGGSIDLIKNFGGIR